MCCHITQVPRELHSSTAPTGVVERSSLAMQKQGDRSKGMSNHRSPLPVSVLHRNFLNCIWLPIQTNSKTWVQRFTASFGTIINIHSLQKAIFFFMCIRDQSSEVMASVLWGSSTIKLVSEFHVALIFRRFLLVLMMHVQGGHGNSSCILQWNADVGWA